MSDDGRSLPPGDPSSASSGAFGALLSETARAPDLDSAALQRQPTAGTRLGRFELLREIGRGGFGVVFEARDTELGRHVAVKVVRWDRLSGPRREQHLESLRREAETAARLHHPNVVTLHDFGVQDGQPYLVLELLRGQTLQERLQGGPLPAREVAQLGLQLCAALRHLHADGVLHRDLKPSNLFLTEGGQVKLLDVGLSLLQAKGPILPAAGTPGFMAPEQLARQPEDARTDLFGAGALLFALLTGKAPPAIPVASPEREKAIAGALSQVPAGLARIVIRALEPLPDKRQGSARELEAALAEVDRSFSQRRTRRIAIGTSAALLAALATGVYTVRRHSQVCSGSASQLAGVWDQDRAAGIDKAFTAVGKPFAIDALARVQAGLKSYAQRWAEAHQEACAATRLRGEQSEELLDLRMQCLAERKQELGALVSLLAQADAKLALRGNQSVQQLSPLEACADSAGLRAPTKPPADGPRRLKVESIRERLARVRALQLGGKYADGEAKAALLVAEAREVGYRPAEAEALLALGRLQQAQAKYSEASKSLLDAALAAQAGGSERVATYAYADLGLTDGKLLGKPERGHQSARQAKALLEHLGPDQRLMARILRTEGQSYDFEGKYADALASYQQALQLVAEAGAGDDGVSTATLHQDIGEELRGLGRPKEALVSHRKALELWEAASGPRHPHVAVALNSLLADNAEMGAPASESLELGRRALAIREEALGPDHQDVAISLQNLAILLNQDGKRDEALALLRRALDIKERTQGKEKPSVAFTLCAMAQTLDEQGKPQEGIPLVERAVAIREKALGPAHPLMVETLVNLGHLYEKVGRPRESLALNERALAIAEKALGPKHAMTAYALNAIGSARADLKDPAGAIAPLERALSIRETVGAPSERTRTRLNLAKALWMAGRDRPRALRLGEQARQELLTAADKGPKNAVDLAKVDKWLAEVAPRSASR